MHFLYCLSRAQFNFLFTAPTSHKPLAPFNRKCCTQAQSLQPAEFIMSMIFLLSCETSWIKVWMFTQGLILV